MGAQSILFDVIARDKASSTFSKIGDSAGKSESHLKRLSSTVGTLAGVAGVAGFGVGLVSFLKDSTAEAREAQKVGALTTQAIKSTGGAANVTAKQVGDLANAISKKVGVDDEAIQSGANMLLTFKNIRNEAGKGNDVFNQAVQTTTDLAAAMAAASGGELNFRTASIQLGKALNDPVKGMTALAKVGVSFTDKQKAVNKALVEGGVINALNAYTGATGDAAITSARFAKIQKDQHLTFDQTVKMLTGPMSAAQQKWFKHLQEGNHTAEAQKNILKELRSEFGGAAASQATAADKAQVALKNLEEQVGTALLPTIDKLANFMTNDAVPAVSKFVSGMQDGTGAGGELAGHLHDLYEVGKGVVDFLNDVPGPVKKFAVEGAIAAVMLNKLNNGLTGSVTGLRGFVNGLGPAERGMTRTQVAAYNLGTTMRNVAGAGGVLALTKSANESSLAIAGLERVGGGAATGFAVAGPLGAAIGGTTGLLWTMKDAFSTNAKATKVSLPTYKQYADTLDGVAASATKATREMVLQRLEQSGLLDATRKLGLSDREAVAAMMGQHTARAKLVDLMRSSTAITMKQKDALQQETGAVGAARLAQLKHNIAVAGSKEELKKARKALRDFMHEPASKRVSVTGVETARAQLKSLRQALRSVWNQGPDLHTAGPGGLNVLLNPGGATKPAARTGGTSTVQNFNFGDVYAANLDDLLHQAQRKSRTNALSGGR